MKYRKKILFADFYGKIFILLLLGALAFLLCAGVFYASDILSEREFGLQTEKINILNRNNARFAEESIRQTLSQADLVLRLIKSDMETAGYISAERQALLKSLRDSQNFDQIVVADVDGNLTFSAVPLQTQLNIFHREHFQAQIAVDTQKMYIAAPWISRATGTPNVFISRRLNDPQGKFSGIVAISLKQDYLDSLFRKLELGESNFITVVRRDGAFLMRSPYIDNAEIKPDQYTKNHAGFDLINQGAMSGTFVINADRSLVGVTRISAFKVLLDYPLVIFVGVTKEEALRDTFQLQKTYYLIAIVFSVFVLLTFLIIGWLLRKQFIAANELEYLGSHDKLTGLLNRYHIEESIDHEIARSERNSNPLSMIVFDLDFFKQVNDNWGHPVGDSVLKHTSQIAKRLLRKSDVFARMGGDEFMVIMPETSCAGARVAAEKIRSNITENPHPQAGLVTVSIGVAECRTGESFGNWYERADDALYQAKKQGRNCIACAEDDIGIS